MTDEQESREQSTALPTLSLPQAYQYVTAFCQAADEQADRLNITTPMMQLFPVTREAFRVLLARLAELPTMEESGASVAGEPHVP